MQKLKKIEDVVERVLESGAVIHAYLCQIRMLDSEDMFNEYCWEDLEN